MNSYNGFTGEKRMEVHRFLRAEESAGRLTWPTCCAACGQTEGVFDCHHENYDDPYSFVGLCYVCHMMLHCRFRAPAAFARYREFVIGGGRVQGQRTRRFNVIRALLDGKDVATEQHSARERDEFTLILRYP